MEKPQRHEQENQENQRPITDCFASVGSDIEKVYLCRHTYVKSQRKETKNENKTKDERPGQLMMAIQSDQYLPRSFFCNPLTRQSTSNGSGLTKKPRFQLLFLELDCSLYFSPIFDPSLEKARRGSSNQYVNLLPQLIHLWIPVHSI